MIFFVLLFTFQTRAGTIVGYNCTPCGAKGQLQLGQGFQSEHPRAAYVCTKGNQSTLVALEEKLGKREPAVKPDCPQGLHRLDLTNGMDCPVCKGSKMEVTVDALWD